VTRQGKQEHSAPVSKTAIAVFGGLFNPVHNGHLAVARLAADYFGFKQIHLFPAGAPPHKPFRPVMSSAHRLAMLKLAVKNDKQMMVHDDEIRRPGISYTIDTLHALQQKYPGKEICFIIGADNLTEIPTWHLYRNILKITTLCVAHRPGFLMKTPNELKQARIATFPSPEWGISSTMIRSLLSQGYRCTGLLPEAVIEYIRRHKLYRSSID
jgi:nicotinate-nucleotide adenylyltransferase